MLLVILLGAIVTYQFFNNKTENKDSLDESIKTGTNIGDTGSRFYLKKVNGEEITLSKLRGNKVIINFWTTDCVFCPGMEMPELQNFMLNTQRYRNTGCKYKGRQGARSLTTS